MPKVKIELLIGRDRQTHAKAVFDRAKKLNYIHKNLIEEGLVFKAEDYR